MPTAPPTTLNSQVGPPLVARNAPIFTGYQVVANTWKPVDTTTAKETKGTNSRIINYNFYGPGTQAGCELVQYVEIPAVQDLKKSMVIQEALDSPNEPGALWVVIKADPIGYDEPPLHFQCELYKGPGLDATKTTPQSS